MGEELKSELVYEDEVEGYKVYALKLSFEVRVTDLIQPFWYCGYVRIPEDHPYYGQKYQDNDREIESKMDVHGGITFSDKKIRRNSSDEGWYIGFDCNHHTDNCEGRENLDFVKGELKSLVEQLKKVKN